MSGRILVVGSYNTDLVGFGAIPRAGQTVRVDRFESLSGGKGSNQAIAAARLGAAVTLCARVGADAYGDEARRLFDAEGIGGDAIIVDPQAHTGVAIVLVDPAGENAIAVAAGSNGQLTSEDIADREALFAEASAVLLQLEIPLSTVYTALELGRRHGCTTLLDPAPATPLSNELLSLVDMLTPNESEASSLVGSEVNDLITAMAAGRALRERGCGRVLVTLGAEGSVFTGPDGCWHIPAPRVRALDTTGAGDAFNGGLAAAIAAGQDWHGAARFATRAAAASVCREGVVRALPRPADLKEIPDSGATQLTGLEDASLKDE